MTKKDAGCCLGAQGTRQRYSKCHRSREDVSGGRHLIQSLFEWFMASSVCCQASDDVSTGQTGGSGIEVDMNECGFTGRGDGPIFGLKLVEQE